MTRGNPKPRRSQNPTSCVEVKLSVASALRGTLAVFLKPLNWGCFVNVLVAKTHQSANWLASNYKAAGFSHSLGASLCSPSRQLCPARPAGICDEVKTRRIGLTLSFQPTQNSWRNLLHTRMASYRKQMVKHEYIHFFEARTCAEESHAPSVN
jgi:hypothetical protein